MSQVKADDPQISLVLRVFFSCTAGVLRPWCQKSTRGDCIADTSPIFSAEFARSGLSLAEAEERAWHLRRQIQRYIAGESPVPKLVHERIREIAKRRAGRRGAASFRFIDLFAGIGGLRLGFEAIGGRCVFTSEWDKYAQKTYARNFPDDEDHVMAGDVRPYGADPSLIPEFDVLLAGFPCQPFSLAGVSKKNSLGRAHGFEDEKQGNPSLILSGSCGTTGRQLFCLRTSSTSRGMTAVTPSR